MGLTMVQLPAKKIPAKRVKKPNNKTTDEEYEVENILDHLQDPAGNIWYLVKWKGWPDCANSWEPKQNLSTCTESIKKYHTTSSKEESNKKKIVKNSSGKIEDYFQVLNSNATAADMCALIKKATNNYSRTPDLTLLKKFVFKNKLLKTPELDPIILKHWLQYQNVQKQLKEWEATINSVSTDAVPILVENYVDLEGPPKDFTYINDYKAGEGIDIPDDPIIGCECDNCFDNRKKCCAGQGGGMFAYTRDGKVNVERGIPIYECNKRCKCPLDCPNRVVQRGRQTKLAIFRTSNGCGWGVKTLEAIKKNTFVMEYVGEVITNEVAEKRGQIYDAQGRTYLFDLDFNDEDCPFTVDAASQGNIAHFMNHSCEPNLVVYAVWINTLDPRLPRLAFFSNKLIRKGEELTFDYLMTAGNSGENQQNITTAKIEAQEPKNRILCKCGTPSCRKYLV